MATSTAKQTTLNMRVSDDVKGLIEQAAETLGMKMSQFVLSKAQEAAEEVLAFKSHYTVDDQTFYDFMEQLNQPRSDAAQALLDRKTRWDQA